ncbi:hypothetical protein [Streptomyces sp. NPDC058644]|uniref:hypothetical protein n=1 Tax=unclassified Streptomyces TaxID=2593676 RepID=UPI0036562C6C
MARGRHRPRRRRRQREQGRPGAQLRFWAPLFGRGILAALLLIALVAGLPWGLCRYVGWPLPDRIPAGREAAASLTAPLGASLLLKVLACALWAAWVAFLGGVLRTAVEGLRRAAGGSGPAVVGGPLKVMAAALLGAAALVLLPGRDPQAYPAAQKRPTTADAARDSVSPSRAGHDGRGTAAPQESTTTAVVRPPLKGVHDSLWRIADRRLDDGDRWPEIYALNYGRRQADGHALMDPGLIRPGWVLRLPAPRPDPGEDPERGHPPVPPTRPAPPSGGAETPPSPVTPPSPSPQPPSATCANLPEGVFIGAGTATLIAAALLIARRRRRGRHRPHRSAHDNAPFAPVIRALRQPSEQTPPPPASAGDPAKTPRTEAPRTGAGDRATGQDDSTTARTPPAAPTARVLGVKDGQDLAWDLARSRGLGLVGPGALDAARALLIGLLAERRRKGAAAAQLVMAAPDADRLLGRHTAAVPARRLRIVADLPQALQLMETELLSRTRARSHAAALVPSAVPSEIVLIAAVPAQQEQRLQAILDNGSALGLAGLLIGQWRAGGTLRVRGDGTVGAANPSHAAAFAGARLFTVPPRPAGAILDLFAETSAERPGRRHTDQDTGAPHGVSAPQADGPNGPPTPPPEQTNKPSSAEITDTTAPSQEEAPPAPPSPRHQQPVRLCVLGPITLTYQAARAAEPVDVTGALAPKQRELLAYLALHRDGIRRETLTAAIWPQAPYTRPSNAFHATLSQLRRSLHEATHGVVHDIVRRRDTRYGLDPQQVSVDLWELKDEVKAARTRERADERQAALWRVVGLYAGDFADEVAGEWPEAPRESLRREYLDSVSALVRLLRDPDPNRALDLLEQARERDRYNEAIYRDIARMQAHLEEHDAIPRTLELLRRALAELDQLPSAVTLRLFAALQAAEGRHKSTSE